MGISISRSMCLDWRSSTDDEGEDKYIDHKLRGSNHIIRQSAPRCYDERDNSLTFDNTSFDSDTFDGESIDSAEFHKWSAAQRLNMQAAIIERKVLTLFKLLIPKVYVHRL